MNYKDEVLVRVFSNNIQYLTPISFKEWMEYFEFNIERSYYCVTKDLDDHYKEILKGANEMLKYIATFREKYKDSAYEMFKDELLEIQSQLESSLVYVPKAFISDPNKKGRKALPPNLAKKILLGIELSMNDYNSYEPFRIYYQNGLQNCFNLNSRLDQNKLYFENTSDINFFDISKFEFIFPSVPSSQQPDTSWARKLKQTLKKAISR